MARYITLNELLKRLPSFKPSFKDTTKRNGYRIRCQEKISNEDLEVLELATKGNKDVTALNNNYEWIIKKPEEQDEQRFVFLLTLTKAPTKIIVRDIKK
jgi:hypothetical protein